MGLFDRNTLSLHETTALLYVLVTMEMMAIFANESVTAAKREHAYSTILRAAAAYGEGTKTLSAIRKHAVLGFVPALTRTIIPMFPSAQVKDWAVMFNEHTANVLHGVEGLPRSVQEFYHVLRNEALRQGLY